MRKKINVVNVVNMREKEMKVNCDESSSPKTTLETLTFIREL
jgi:hypothetical protein